MRNADPGGLSRRITRHYAKHYTGEGSNAAHELDEIVSVLPKREPPGPKEQKGAAERHRRALEQAAEHLAEAERALRVASQAACTARIEDWISGYLAVQLAQWREKIAACRAKLYEDRNDGG